MAMNNKEFFALTGTWGTCEFCGLPHQFCFCFGGGTPKSTYSDTGTVLNNDDTNATDMGMKVDCMLKPIEASAKHFI